MGTRAGAHTTHTCNLSSPDREGGWRWPEAQSAKCSRAVGTHEGQVAHVGGITSPLCGRGVGTQRGEGHWTRSHGREAAQAGLAPGPCLLNAPQAGLSLPGARAFLTREGGDSSLSPISRLGCGPCLTMTLGPECPLSSSLPAGSCSSGPITGLLPPFSCCPKGWALLPLLVPAGSNKNPPGPSPSPGSTWPGTSSPGQCYKSPPSFPRAPVPFWAT